MKELVNTETNIETYEITRVFCPSSSSRETLQGSLFAFREDRMQNFIDQSTISLQQSQKTSDVASKSSEAIMNFAKCTKRTIT